VGAGVLTLTAAANYSGDTVVANGRLSISNGDDRLPAATNLILGAAGITPTSGVFDLNGRSQTVASATIEGSGGGNEVANVSGANSPTFTINLTVADSTFAGRLGPSGANFNFTKSGSKTLTLSAPNVYTGTTTVSAGKLIVGDTHGAFGPGAGDYVVAANATLGGSGTVTPASGKSLTLSGTIAPGSSAGNFTLSNAAHDSTTVLAPGGSYQWEVSNQTGSAGVHWDLLTLDLVTVTATSGSKFTVNVVGLNINGGNWNAQSGEKHFKIADSTTGAFGALTPAELQQKFAVVVSGFTPEQNLGGFYLNVDGGGDLELVYVPEPACTATLLATGVAALARPRRRRTRCDAA
jgi:autotransporter-associated beta strand protein